MSFCFWKIPDKQFNHFHSSLSNNFLCLRATNKQAEQLQTLRLWLAEMLLGSRNLWEKKENWYLCIILVFRFCYRVFDAAETDVAIAAPTRRRQIGTAAFACSLLVDIYKQEKAKKKKNWSSEIKYFWETRCLLTQCCFPESTLLNSARFSLFTCHFILFPAELEPAFFFIIYLFFYLFTIRSCPATTVGTTNIFRI